MNNYSGIYVFSNNSSEPMNIEQLSTDERMLFLNSKSKDYIIEVVNILCDTINKSNKIINFLNE